MNWNSVKYCLKEGFSNVFSNGVMSLASISVMVCCMVLTGSAVLLSMNLSNILKSVENQNIVTVFLKKDISTDDISEAQVEISNTPNILKCEYYSSAQASERYREVLGEIYETLHKKGNPFPEAFHVTMTDLSLYEQTVENLSSIKNVDSVSDRSETAQKLANLSKFISTSGIWTVCSLGLISMFIIVNTIRLTMHSRRMEISIMKSVGATNGFICAPFMVEGIVIGIAAAFVSSFILNLTYYSFIDVVGQIISFHGVYFKNIFFKVLGYFSLAGLFFGLVGGMISIRRYLKKEGVNFAG